MKKNRIVEEKRGYVVAIIFNLIFLYVFNNLLNWHVYFVTTALNSVLWIINLSIIVAVIGNALLMLYNPEFFRHVMTTIINIFAFVAIFFLYNVFPFNFNNFYIYWGLNILLIILMIVLAISIIIELYYLMTRKPKIKTK